MENDFEGRELVTAEAGTIELLAKSEIDMQIATAHKYPRSIKQFRTDVFNMVTLSESVAAECIYALKRDNKMIEGPSARFAEVVASAWGNSRAGARVVSDQGDFVTAQGVFHDLQKNVAITFEVQRRIVGKNGNRFGVDMIGVTANAACSIALRNAILKGVPKAFWSDMYEHARKTALGDVKTLPTRRAEAFEALQRYGVSPEQAFAKLGVKGKEDIGLEELATLRFILTAIKEGDATPEQAFAVDAGEDKPHVTQPKRKSEANGTSAAVAAMAGAAAQAVGTVTGQSGAEVLQGATDRAEQALTPPQAAATGEVITPNQVKYLRQKFASFELDDAAVATMLARLAGGAKVEMLTPEQFDAVKAELASMS